MINTLSNLKSAFSPERQELSDKYVAVLAHVLNELHGEQYSLRFWTFLVGKYVGSVITNIELYSAPDFEIILTNEAVSGFGRPGLKNKVKNGITQFIKGLKTSKNETKLFELLAAYDSLHIGFPDLEVVTSDLGVKLPAYTPIYSLKKNKKLRKQLRSLAQKQENILLQNMINGLPKLFVEGFKEVMDSIPLYDPTSKSFHYQIASNFYLWLLAKYTENGAKLYWYQHGAYYGELQYGGQVRERKLADVYRTWGWKIEEKDEPWKAYRLLNFIKNYKEEKTPKKYQLLLVFGPINGAYTDTQYYTEFMKEFDSLVDSGKYNSILARPRPTSKVFSRKGDLSFMQNYSYVEISSGLQPIAEEIAQSELVFQVSVPSTNFLECLVINKPVVGILNNDQITSVVQPFYDFLLENKVLHLTLDSLVLHINDLDVATWWNAVSVHPTFIAFKETFAKLT